MSCINFTSSRIRLTYIIASFLVFLGGITIYVFFRNHNVLLFQFFPKPAVLDLLHFPVRIDNVLVSLFLYNLPDGLWFLSGLLLIRAVWFTDFKWRALYACLFGLVAVSMEISQIFDSVPGTFDLLDIAFMALFALAESTFFNMSIKRSIV